MSFHVANALPSGNYVNYGCGWGVGDDWLNFDASPTLMFERIPVLGRVYKKNSLRFQPNVRYGDILRGLPVPTGSCKGVFASHVLEHLSLDEFGVALRNTYAMLQAGGVFRLVVPDLRACADDYLRSDDPLAAAKFMQATGLGVRSQPKNFIGWLSKCFGHSAHQWMWDFNSLRVHLEQAGFRKIRQCHYGDAEDRLFCQVEDQSRFEKAVGVECMR